VPAGVSTSSGVVAAGTAAVKYQRRRPETTALYRTMQEHLATFEQQWSDPTEGRSLPRFVTEELRGFLSCGVLARGFAQLFCDTCRERHLVAFCAGAVGFARAVSAGA
jgi:hypothetical protein